MSLNQYHDPMLGRIMPSGFAYHMQRYRDVIEATEEAISVADRQLSCCCINFTYSLAEWRRFKAEGREQMKQFTEPAKTPKKRNQPPYRGHFR